MHVSNAEDCLEYDGLDQVGVKASIQDFRERYRQKRDIQTMFVEVGVVFVSQQPDYLPSASTWDLGYEAHIRMIQPSHYTSLLYCIMWFRAIRSASYRPMNDFYS